MMLTSYRNEDEDAETIIKLIKRERERQREKRKDWVWLSIFEKQNMQKISSRTGNCRGKFNKTTVTNKLDTEFV